MYNLKHYWIIKKIYPKETNKNFFFINLLFLKKHFLLFYLKNQKRRNHETQKN